MTGEAAVAKTTLAVPDIGGSEDAEVIEICVAVGDAVELEQSLIVLESDKASMEIPATAAGTVVEVLVKEGDQLAEGAPIAVVETGGGEAAAGDSAAESEKAAPQPEAAADSAKTAPTSTSDSTSAASQAAAGSATESEKAAPQPETAAANDAATGSAETAPSASTPTDTATDSAKATPAAASPSTTSTSTPDSIHAGPAVRKLARELGVNLSRIQGSGPKGRILKEDIQNFVKRSLQGDSGMGTAGAGIPPVPKVDFSAFGEVDIQPLTKVDKVTAANMHRNWLNVPHVTQFGEADVTDMEAFRVEMKAEAERHGVKLTPLPFLLKACATALRDNPRFNASLAGDGEHIAYKRYVHVGVAVDTPAGLMVPVIRDVDRKNLWELAAETAELAIKAKERKLTPAEMQGGCFTISSLGNIGGTGFTPIINTPEVAILGVSRLETKPIWNGTDFEPRQMLPLSLSYDHRVVNGADAGRFMGQLDHLLGDIRRLLL